jgi:catalase
MPLPQDERIVALANDLLQQFDRIFGLHPGFRPAHAKGLLLKGSFTPAVAARSFTRAPHMSSESTPVTVRFSNSTGIPSMPDSSPDANPRGMAVRFHLGERVHTDIVAHSTDGFPTRDGKEFLEFIEAVAATVPGAPSPKPIEVFLRSHPAALAFVLTPKPFAASLARQTYFGVNAFAFTNAASETRFGRYRILPEAGQEFLSAEHAAQLPPDFHFEEIAARVGKGPVRFKLVAQVAAPGDVTDDATVHWPEAREQVELGTITLTQTVPETLAEQKHIIFDPIPRLDGIEPSADPLLELRAAVYLISGRRRRAAPVAEQSP